MSLTHGLSPVHSSFSLFLLEFSTLLCPTVAFPSSRSLPTHALFCPDPGQGCEPDTPRRLTDLPGWRVDGKHMGSLRSVQKQLRDAEASNGKKHERREETWQIELKSINVEALIHANVFVCAYNVLVLSFSNL